MQLVGLRLTLPKSGRKEPQIDKGNLNRDLPQTYN